MACALILSLCFIGGCSKDDGPSSGAKIKGNFKVDGKKVDLKYGYVYYDDDYTEYSFFDIDMLKYSDLETKDMDFEFSCLWVSYDNSISHVDEISIEYKINYSKQTGTYYDFDDASRLPDVSLSNTNGKIKCSSKSIPLTKYNFHYNNDFGEYDASFSVEGKAMDMTDFDYNNSESRSVIITEVSEPKEIAFLKSLNIKNRKTSIDN